MFCLSRHYASSSTTPARYYRLFVQLGSRQKPKTEGKCSEESKTLDSHSTTTNNKHFNQFQDNQVNQSQYKVLELTLKCPPLPRTVQCFETGAE
mgnify:CR=1 FL=1